LVLFTTSKGVPYETAMEMEPLMLMAHSIILRELELPEEKHFDFERMQYRE
jgi:hypothetical protein